MNKLLEFFQSTADLSNIGFIVRTVVSLFLIYLMSRILMKRAAGQFTAFDFVFLWMLGALAVSPLLDGKILFTNTVIALTSLYFWHFFISWLTVINRTFAKLFTRKPILLIEKGIIKEKNMRHSFFNNDLLLSEMRLADATDIKEVDQVILESNGHLSIVKKSQYTTPTPADFQIQVPPGGLPAILINNGQVNYDNLKSLHLTEKWLKEQLNKYGVIDTKDVYLATLSSNGDFYYSVKNNY